jgi:hypothetical protein
MRLIWAKASFSRTMPTPSVIATKRSSKVCRISASQAKDTTQARIRNSETPIRFAYIRRQMAHGACVWSWNTNRPTSYRSSIYGLDFYELVGAGTKTSPGQNRIEADERAEQERRRAEEQEKKTRPTTFEEAPPLRSIHV